MKLGPYLATYTEINSKWIKDLNAISRPVKVLEENRKKKMHLNFGLDNAFLDMMPKNTGTIAKINILKYIKLESFCKAKETINKMKRQPAEWEKIFANSLSDKRLTSKIYKKLL